MSIQTSKSVNESLLRIIKDFSKEANSTESYLKKKPEEWGKFQNNFNKKVNNIFEKIMTFEVNNLNLDNKTKVDKLKKLFVNKLRKPYERGNYIKWVIKKPYGYPGDFRYLEDLYENKPSTSGFDRLFDNYTMMSPIAIAVRNRKNDFKNIIMNYLLKTKRSSVRIMNLGSGPCREIYEMQKENSGLFRGVVFDCFDLDDEAIKFSKKRLNEFRNINFYKLNVLKLAKNKDIEAFINKKYDIIYSTGLFDYFEDLVATKLISNLYKLLNLNGILLISDVRDKYSNPSLIFMGWVGDWDLVYRSDDDFRKMFQFAGFKENNIFPFYEQQGILQYIMAIKE